MPMDAGRQDLDTQTVFAGGGRACATNRGDIKPVLVLTLLCALLFGSGLTAIPVLDRDEARFAQATYQMLDSGDFWAISFQDVPRTKKPHGIYWLQAASVWAFSSIEAKAIWAYRLPSAFGAWIAVLFCYLLGRDLFDRHSALIAAMLLAVTPVVIAEAHIATADGVLLACVIAAYWALARSYMAGHGGPRPGSGIAFLFWSAICGAILIKGPIGPGVVALSALTLCIIERRLSLLKPLWPITGAVVVGIIIAGWAYRAGLSHEGGFVRAALGEDFFPKLFFGQESHGAPPGTHALIALVALGPAVPFVLLGLFGAYRNWQLPAVRFCVAWLAPGWIIIELVATKLPHYTLPLYPALILLACWTLGRADLAKSRGARVALVTYAVFTTVLLMAVIGNLTIPVWQPGLASQDILALALIGVSASLATIYFGASGRPHAFAVMSIAAVTAIAVCAAAFTTPRIEPFWMTDRIVEGLERYPSDRPRRLVSVGYHEPSLVFNMGTDTALVSHMEAARLASSEEELVFAIDQRWRAAFEQETAANGRRLVPKAAVWGFSYTSGRWRNIWLYIP